MGKIHDINGDEIEFIFPKNKKIFLIKVYENINMGKKYLKKIDCWYN